mgnify:FL=1
MVTMKEALQDVNVHELNDFEQTFYDKNKNGSYEPSDKQMGVIRKMPKITGQSNGSDNYQSQDPSVKYEEMEKNLQYIDKAFDMMEKYPNLNELDQENKRAIAISCAINQSRADYFNGKK